tara:strand:+ start:285 stop:500 length:216 start_codon:yes stop_codon:yes gene_type:complete
MYPSDKDWSRYSASGDDDCDDIIEFQYPSQVPGKVFPKSQDADRLGVDFKSLYNCTKRGAEEPVCFGPTRD